MKDIILKVEDYIKLYRDRIKLDLGSDFKVDFLAQGEYNQNFLISSGAHKYVFRLNYGSQLALDNQIAYEYGALEALEGSFVTPRPLYLDDSKDFFPNGLLIMEFLEGRHLDYRTDSEAAAQIFSNIHSLKVTDSMKDHFIAEEKLFKARIEEGEKLLESSWDSDLISKETKNIFYKHLDYLYRNLDREEYFLRDPWMVINNTEVNSNNFIIGRENYLIDWEKPVISDPSQDLSQFLAATTTLWKTDFLYDEEGRKNFFKTYISNLKTEDKSIEERVRLYTPYLLIRAFGWCSKAYIEYHDPNKAIKNMDTFRVIESFLRPDFMKKVLNQYL